MTMHIRLSIFAIAALRGLPAVATLAHAEDTPAWKSCVSTTNTGAQRFASCTEVIESKAETGRRLAAAYCIRGHEKNEKRELDGALADLDEAIRLDPTYACSYNNRGRTYAFKGDLDRAIADYSEALKIDFNMFIAYNNRGDAYFHKRQLDEAIVDFSVALKIAPNYALAYANRARAYHAMRRLQARGRRLHRADPSPADGDGLSRPRQRLSGRRTARPRDRGLRRGDQACPQ